VRVSLQVGASRQMVWQRLKQSFVILNGLSVYA